MLKNPLTSISIKAELDPAQPQLVLYSFFHFIFINSVNLRSNQSLILISHCFPSLYLLDDTELETGSSLFIVRTVIWAHFRN